jgi:polyisoprenoid-binding protein YceI
MARLTGLLTALALTAVAVTALPFVPANGHVVSEGAPAGTWRIDPARSVVEFTVTKLGFADVTGRFTEFTGSVRYDPAQPGNSSVEWKVRVASIETDAANRDKTLQEPEYFDARRHPELGFRSTRVRTLRDGRLEVDGALTIKGITRPQRIVATPVDGGFQTTFELDRFDFEIVGGRVMRRLIGRTVRVRLTAIAEQEDQ